MIKELVFKDEIYEHFKQHTTIKIVRSRFFDMSDRLSQLEYKNILSKFNKWVFYWRSYTFNKSTTNQLFFDFERMITEYSTHYGIKSGEEMISDMSMKTRIKSVSKSVEALLEDSMKDLNENLSNTIDPNYKTFISEIGKTWDKSFVINCVPNVLNGNYVNIPIEMVSEKELGVDVATFENDKSYFFDFFNAMPLKISKIKIDKLSYYNMINISIVPLFITLSKKYIIDI